MEKGLQPLNELLIGERVFEVPPYQRQYSWDKRQLEDLWEDIYYLDPPKKHFFGTILLKDTDRKKVLGISSYRVSEIIDGQQRITTVLIFLREIINELRKYEGEDFTEEEILKLETDYLRYKSIYKLELLGDDAEFFQNNIIEGIEAPKEISTPSRQRLMDAQRFFHRKLKAEKKEDKEGYKEFLLGLKDKIGSLEVIRYAVEKDEDAILIFETVNDRGKDLSRLDKTKSFLMHIAYLCMDEEEDPAGFLSKLNKSFGKIYRYIEQIRAKGWGEDFDEEGIQSFHFVIRETYVKEKVQSYMESLKSSLREEYRTDKKACLKHIDDYVTDLEACFLAMKEIVNYSKDDDLKNWLGKVFNLGRTANFMPLLLALWIKTKASPEKLVKILKVMESISFRVYAIGRRRSDTGIGNLREIANSYYNDEQDEADVKEGLESFRDDWEDDSAFDNDFRIPDFYNKISTSDIKYFFYEYEQHLRDKAMEPLQEEFENWMSDSFEIEHIWAENEEVGKKLEEEHEDNKERLGNLAVASRSWNSSWGNKPFSIKRKKYAKSGLQIQKEIAENVTWRKKQIEAREDGLCEFASKRWR